MDRFEQFPSTDDANANLSTNLADLVGNGLWIEQLESMAVTIVLSVVATVIITTIVKMLVGLRPSDEDERMGLDLVEHGEADYNY